jgi:hypothetical protein
MLIDIDIYWLRVRVNKSTRDEGLRATPLGKALKDIFSCRRRNVLKEAYLLWWSLVNIVR